MAAPLLLQYYQLLPHQPLEDQPSQWTKRFKKGLGKFRRSVEARYNEASLEKLLHHPLCDVRQGACLALGMVGTMAVNANLAARLHDDDPAVRMLAADALWSVWLRADSQENSAELQRLMQLNPEETPVADVLSGFDALIRQAPRFAEAYNQRAIFYFRIGDYAKAIADCEKTLRLNHFHFGAANGIGQCFMKLRKLRAALRYYRRAARINPNLDGVKQTIESLERILGEEGRR